MDQEQLQGLLKDIMAKGASDADMIFSAGAHVTTEYRNGQHESIERAESHTLGVRVLLGKRQAIASTSDLSRESVDGMIDRLFAMASLAPEDPYIGLAAPEQLACAPFVRFPHDTKEPSLSALSALAHDAEQVALSEPGITKSDSAEAYFSRSHVYLLTSQGFAGHYEESRTGVSVRVIAEKEGQMERDYAFSSALTWDRLQDARSVGKEAAFRTLRRLGAKPVASGKMPVIFSKEAARSILGAVASAANGSAIARKSSFLLHKRDQQIAHQGITIIDDPLLPEGLSSYPFDGEGLAGQRLALVENGFLREWLLDLHAARQLNLAPNGHAGRGAGSVPHPTSSNLYIAAGKLSEADLIGSIEEGLYITELFGMGINTITGDYSQGASGLRIHKGKLDHAVHEITIAGNLNEMLQYATPANNLEFKYGSNSPSLKIEQMTVAASG